jgi:PTS system nitrogen regulatory IIA component
LAIQERIKDRIAAAFDDLRKCFKREEAMAILKYLDPQLVLFVQEDKRDEVLELLVDALDKAGKLHDKKLFHQAILEREKIVSTGIGIGVAVPHAKQEGYDDFFIAIAIQKRQGIEWNAIDGAPVHLVFMIGGPDNRQTEYLKILSRLTVAIKDEERRKKLLAATSPAQAIALFEGC